MSQNLLKNIELKKTVKPRLTNSNDTVTINNLKISTELCEIKNN